MIAFAREFSFPSAATFDIPPIHTFVQRYLATARVSVDPFCGGKAWATFHNDLNPECAAQEHKDAGSFLADLKRKGVQADLGIFDPPYSPRQISEHYRAAGKLVSAADTQNGRLYRRVRDALDEIMAPGGVVLSFGWNSVGMGISRGYSLIEVLLVPHGGAHNDTICIAERKG